MTFWRLAKAERPAIVGAGVFGALGALVKVAQAVIVLLLLRQLDGWRVTGDGAATAWALVLVLITATLAGELLTREASKIAHHADNRFGRSLRHRQITHLQRLPLDWFARNGSGRVKKFVQDDVFRVHELVAHLVPDLTASVVTPLVSLALLFWWDPVLGLIALVPLTLAALALPMVLRGRDERARDYAARLGDLNAAVVELIRGIEPIKLFGAQERGYPRFARASRAMARSYEAWVHATRGGFALIGAFTSPAFAVAVMGVGGAWAVLTTGLDPLLVVPALILAAGLSAPLSLAVGMIQQFRNANAAASDLNEFFELPQQPEGEGTDGEIVGAREAAVEVDAVTFRYPDGPVAIDGMSLTLRPGTLTALVGPSGSGKSTFAALLPRLLDPDAGAVRLGGVDLREIGGPTLYDAVAFVFQQPYMFRMSVRDNIALTRPDATDDEVRAAAEAAQIHRRILELPLGYDSIVGVDAQLSGGEQQRLSIARALLTDAPVLVLDEATAYADPDSEAAVQRALSVLTRDRTVLAIAHRLHTVTGADQIAVLDGGRIVEVGAHDELLAAGGGYARTWGAYAGARERLKGVSA
ncbi:ABC transporter ATP-binding protein [Microbacterium sp. No. 7]|uniref:ABC transporter ATP-binding protein n=1 Tax=Microbacterium sp. No. 7 TaxID=1714373 RepID=UPI0006D06C56|nr:ABC transporter ATP-binding protein [Microbacterium sp. No. 7]ALJ22217.1 hypothetical protein AOA12_20960 [Microbacterium sp. No. 7]